MQLISHVPFVYYIAKENLLMAVDEYYSKNLTKMVDRVAINNLGDPRFYLAELKLSENENFHKVYVHRQPYMKMDN